MCGFMLQLQHTDNRSSLYRYAVVFYPVGVLYLISLGRNYSSVRTLNPNNYAQSCKTAIVSDSCVGQRKVYSLL